jgi:dynein heavy chain
LFPGVERPVIDYGELFSSIKETCSLPEFNLEAVEVFLSKIIQLYDTIQVRHGLMLVGPTGGGKTEAYRVLKTSLTKLEHRGFYKVNTHILNPKSITMGQLYGMFNEASR